MSKRLQVMLSEDELEALREDARRHGMTVSEWVRQALRKVRRESSSGDVARKRAAIRRAAQFNGPTGDIEQILAEIERGYLEG